MTEPNIDLYAQMRARALIIERPSLTFHDAVILDEAVQIAQDALDAQAETLAVAHRAASITAYQRGASHGRAELGGELVNLRSRYADLVAASEDVRNADATRPIEVWDAVAALAAAVDALEEP